MTDQPPVPPPGMPHFERPPTQAVPAPPSATPAPGAAPSARTAAPSSAPSHPIARRPWVFAAGAAGAVVVAAAAGYGYGRQVEPAATSTTDGTSAVVSTGDQQQVDPGAGPVPFELPGTATEPGQGPGDPSGGFGAQPGTVTPGHGQPGPTTRSAGS